MTFPRFLSRAFLDERLVPEMEADTVQYFDHLRRYLFAQTFVWGKTVLDIACGTGYGSDILRRGGAREVISLDLSAQALAYAANRWKALRLCQADAGRLPLPAGSSEVVVSFETLEHLPDPDAFLREVARVLTPDGVFVLSTPNRALASPGSVVPFSPYHTFEPLEAELRDLLVRNGWHLQAMYGMKRSSAVPPPTHSDRVIVRADNPKPAWGAYLRRWLRAWLPPAIYHLLQRARHIPTLDIADALITESTENATYFLVVARKAT
jgi:2-polyprenyl-3-methyl-5-hydroxy-6-metoxy-1,4-benzoquinol methylase